MKITDLRVFMVDPTGQRRPESGYLFLQVETDEGITGLGGCTSFPADATLAIATTCRWLANVLVGEDPRDVNRLWHLLFRRYTFLGSCGFTTSVVSGIDIALWDIAGQALGQPVYRLLGGAFRETVPLYANGWFGGCQTPDDYASAARRTIEAGHTALKCDPFPYPEPRRRGYVDGLLPAALEEIGVARVAAVREAVGPQIEILIDAHGRYNVPTAVRLARRLEPYHITWFEEPLPPESVQGLRSVREQVSVPISVGERLYTRFDFLPILEQRLTDFVMPDVLWTGGISELVRIATLAETYNVPVSPHDVMGPVQMIASAHAMMAVPNFYRLEHSVAGMPHYQACLDQPIEYRDGYVRMPERPGLGFRLNPEFVEANRTASW